MTLTVLERTATTDRVYVTEYRVLMMHGASVVLDAAFENPSARLTAIVDKLLEMHDEVASGDVAELLAPFGGANPEAALQLVIELYANHGVDVDLHCSEHARDAGPETLYTAFTEYGDGVTVVEHYPSAHQRLAELRLRAEHLSDTLPRSYFRTADEDACKAVIEHVLAPARLHLLQASRQAVGEVYISRTAP